MTDLAAIVDDAKLLRPGDVVAITLRSHLSDGTRSILREQLSHTHEEFGVKFVLFEDCDLTVLRPVEDE